MDETLFSCMILEIPTSTLQVSPGELDFQASGISMCLLVRVTTLCVLRFRIPLTLFTFLHMLQIVPAHLPECLLIDFLIFENLNSCKIKEIRKGDSPKRIQSFGNDAWVLKVWKTNCGHESDRYRLPARILVAFSRLDLP